VGHVLLVDWIAAQDRGGVLQVGEPARRLWQAPHISGGYPSQTGGYDRPSGELTGVVREHHLSNDQDGAFVFWFPPVCKERF